MLVVATQVIYVECFLPSGNKCRCCWFRFGMRRIFASSYIYICVAEYNALRLLFFSHLSLLVVCCFIHPVAAAAFPTTMTTPTTTTTTEYRTSRGIHYTYTSKMWNDAICEVVLCDKCTQLKATTSIIFYALVISAVSAREKNRYEIGCT